MTTLRRLSLACAMASFVLAAGLPFAANAQSQADLTQLLEAMKRVESRATALEARLAALEGENKQAKKDTAAARAEAQALRNKLERSSSAPAVPAVERGIYAMVTKAPPPARVPSWGGRYWGSAFGLGSMRGKTNGNSIELFTQTLGQGSISQTTTTNANLTGRDVGALANLFLGYNFAATPNVILGGQVDGGVSNIRVRLSGSGTSSASGTSGSFLPGNVGNLFPFTSTGVFSASDNLDGRWMVSLLARGGVLVDPWDLVYGLGGYTYGRFEGFGTGLGLNGATIGGGWERYVASGWTLRGEMRYTKFQSKDFTESSASTTTQTVACNCFPNVVSMNDTVTRTQHVSADMYSVWLGVAHQFGY